MAVLRAHNSILKANGKVLVNEGDSVVIGGRTYRTVTIGTQTWLAENLDFKFPGLVVGASGTSSSEPRGNYYDNDEITYGEQGSRFGLLYNMAAVRYLQNNRDVLIPGWHVPDENEWASLVSAVGGSLTAGKMLKSKSLWSSGNGTDDYGFSLLPAGGSYTSFFGVYSRSILWTTTFANAGFYQSAYFDSTDSVNFYGTNELNGSSIRLVKDV